MRLITGRGYIIDTYNFFTGTEMFSDNFAVFKIIVMHSSGGQIAAKLGGKIEANFLASCFFNAILTYKLYDLSLLIRTTI